MLSCSIAFATDYHVGPSQALTTIGSVPWGNLQAGDNVFIHWRSAPYKEKWVINAQGTAANRIRIIGVSGSNGEKPIIDGDGAITSTTLNYWGENRGVIKIGGSSVPSDGLPNYITIENLEIKSAHDTFQFTDDTGNVNSYVGNAAAIYVEKCANLIIRDCVLHDSGNGLFIGEFNGQSEHILIENNYIYGNGNVGSAYEHNSYTEAIDITFQYNRYGPLRAQADGNNLKDRSAGLVVKFNWIEGGNRQLDLVEAQGSAILVNHPSYSTTHVFGNILIEPDGDGNQQIVHYGGDSDSISDFRKGTLYFYNNTVISHRAGNTTLIRLSTVDETAEIFNNVIYTTATGDKMALTNVDGTVNFHHNWINENWVNSHSTFIGTINDAGNNVTGTDPLFENFSLQEFKPLVNSSLVNQGGIIPASLIVLYNVNQEYAKHTSSVTRSVSGGMDIGAYEYDLPAGIENLTEENILGVFPNPVIDELFILSTGIKSLIIYDYRGIIVLSRDNVSASSIDVHDLIKGVYFLEIKTSDDNKTVRFVKE